MRENITFKGFHKNPESVFINLISPSTESVTVKWDSPEKNFSVNLYKSGSPLLNFQTDKNEVSIDKLEANSSYEIEIISKKGFSHKRPFSTGDFRGMVINFLDKTDNTFDYSGNFLGSPCIQDFKGNLFVTMDQFKNGGTSTGHIGTDLFMSRDKGKTWFYVLSFVPAQWGRLFVRDNLLYFVGTDVINKGINIINSEDGLNWSAPLFLEGYLCAPTAIVNNDKYIMVSVTSQSFLSGSNDSHIAVARCDVSKGIMNADAWVFSNVVTPEFSWGGDQTKKYAEEGNMVEFKGKFYDILRFGYKKALMLEYSPKTNLLQFSQVIDLECGWCKFFIFQNNNFFYSVGNTTCFPRAVIKLYRSRDLKKWEEVKTIDDISSFDKNTNGIQYPYPLTFEGRLLLLVRTALNGAETFHNSNAIVLKEVFSD